MATIYAKLALYTIRNVWPYILIVSMFQRISLGSDLYSCPDGHAFNEGMNCNCHFKQSATHFTLNEHHGQKKTPHVSFLEIVNKWTNLETKFDQSIHVIAILITNN